MSRYINFNIPSKPKPPEDIYKPKYKTEDSIQGGETMETITIKTQAEFDMIKNTFEGIIYLKNGQNLIIVNRVFSNTRIIARENSSVVARENSSVDLCGFSQARIMDRYVAHKTAQKARVILPFETVEDFCEYYGIKISERKNKKVTMYKAVHKKDEKYCSDYKNSFEYKIGKVSIEENINTDSYEGCGAGLHISTMQFALDFGKHWDDLAILEVEANVEDIVVCKFSDGKIRTSKLKVIREVPLEECGLYGKILSKLKK